MPQLPQIISQFSLSAFLKRYWLALAIAALCGLLQGLGLDEILRYDRGRVSQGDYWLWLTANFVHLGWAHYWMNMGALGLLWLMFVMRLSTAEWIFLFIATSLFCSLCLEHWNTELYYYVGLSGTLHGVISAGVWREWKYDKVFCLSVGTLVGLKLAYEQIVGPLPGSEESAGGNVIVDAHLYGAIGGIFSVVLLGLFKNIYETFSRDG